MMYTVTLKFRTEDRDLINELVTSWLEDEGLTIRTAGAQASVDLTFVKEHEVS